MAAWMLDGFRSGGRPDHDRCVFSGKVISAGNERYLIGATGACRAF